MSINELINEPDGASLLKTLQQYELVDINHPEFSLIRLFSGTINRNFKVYDGNKTILLKVFSKNNILPINRQQVFKMQEELAILGLSPVPLFLSEDANIYCEQWVDIDTKGEHHKAADENVHVVDNLADTLHSIHNSYVSAPLIELSQHWEMYWQKLAQPSISLQYQYSQASTKWQTYMQKHRDQFVLCHNDLHVEHLSFQNGPIFDWEYAGLGCRYFDIASCCAINELAHVDILRLCNRYAHLSNEENDAVIHKVQFAGPLVAFTYELWAHSLGIDENLA